MIRIILIFNITVFLVDLTFAQFIPGLPTKTNAATNLFQNHVYAISDLYADAAREELGVQNVNSRSSVWNYAILQQEICHIRMEQSFAEKDIQLMLKEILPEHASVQASIDLGIYYFQRKMFREYLLSVDQINTSDLPDELATEVLFKNGYAYFVFKEFELARKMFRQITTKRSTYIHSAQYYEGLCAYFLGDYKKAVTLFEASASNKIYKAYVPYYICQIQFSEKNYAELITYAEKVLKDKSIEHIKEIRLLLGQAYFAEKKFEKALDHLVYFEQQSDSLSTEEFYQIGFSYYKSKKYAAAIERFLVIKQDKTLLGQLSNYYMADAYLQTGDKLSARSSFLNASLISDIPELKDESTFHYAKLSAEAGYEREAIYAFNLITSESMYFKDAQELIRLLLENSSDLEFALDIVRDLRIKSPSLNATLQRLLFKAGAVAFANEKFSESREYLISVSEMSYDTKVKAESLFWLGNLEYKLFQFARARSYFDQFISVGKDLVFPDEVSPLVVYYYNGYISLKLQQKDVAFNYFLKCTEAYHKRKDYIRNVVIHDDLYPDAMIKCGELLLEKKSLKQALPYFQKMVSLKVDDSDYAQFQTGHIYFMLQDYQEALPYLQKYSLKEELPYQDEATMMLGIAYEKIGQSTNALKMYERIIKQNKSVISANYARFQSGVILSKKKEFEAAIALFKFIMTTVPDTVVTRKTLAKLEEIYIKELASPESYYTYVQTIPGYEMAETRADSLSFALAYQKYKEQSLPAAVESFTKYIYNYSNGTYLDHAIYYRGMAQLKLSERNAAVRDFELLIQKPESRYFAEALFQKGKMLMETDRDSTKASSLFKESFENAIDMNLKNQSAQQYLVCIQNASDSIIAETFAGHLLDSPLLTDQDKNKWALFSGKKFIQLNDLKRALSFLRFLPDTLQHENGAEARYLIASTLYRQHKLNDAEQACHFANTHNKYYPFWIAKTILLQADIYYDTNDYLNTRAALEALLTHFSDEIEIKEEARAKLGRLEQAEKERSKIKKEKNKLKLDSNGKN